MSQRQSDNIIMAMRTKYVIRLMWWMLSGQVGKLNRFTDLVNKGMSGDAAYETLKQKGEIK